MTTPLFLERQDLIDMLAGYSERTVESDEDRIDSLELAWLLHQMDERYGTALDLDDDQLARITTVSTALEVFREVRAGAGDA
ncbi:acyl carrier protein [Streptomyces sp. NPDC003011]